MRAILALLLSAVGCCAQLSDPAFLASLTTPAVSAPSYIIQQGFEGTGFDNGETWTKTGPGLVNEDYTTIALDGSQSFHVGETNNTAYATSIFASSQSEVWGYFLFRADALPTGLTRMFGFMPGVAGLSLECMLNTTGTVLIRNGSSGSATTVDAMSANTTYHVWVHFKVGAGGDGLATVGFSTTGTEPTSGNAFASHTTGNATSNADRVRVGVYTSGTNQADFTYDKIRVKTSSIGSNPT